MNTVLRYPGSKWRIADQLVSNIPEHKSYLEPYFGSGAVLFNKPPSPIETINDLDDDVINLFQCIRDHSQQLAAMIAAIPYSRKVYDSQFSIVSKDPVDKACAFLIKCWQGYGFKTSGIKTGWKRDKTGRERAYNLSNWYHLPEWIEGIAERLRNIQIEHKPALDLIREFDSPDSFFYLDPPYLLNTRSAKQYQHEMTEEDHIQLLETIVHCSAQIMISGFVVIPRKMQDVQEMLAHTHKEIPEIIQREQDLLDVLRFKCKQNAQNGKIASPSETILDMLGITIRECTYGENQQILKHLGKESQKYFKRAFRVQNIQTERRFYEWMSENGYTKKDIHCYFHGSKNQNYLGLLSEGPLLNPDAPITGKMFGYGIYLAPRAKKSINYTDISGSVWAKGKKHRAYLAVYKTAYNNAKDIYTWTSSMTGYRASNIFPNDAVFAHKGSSLINDEVIIYREEQLTIQYLIELQI